jgi:uncharacterized protein YneR
MRYYKCKKCKFFTKNKYDYNIHCQTKKHLSLLNYCNICNKSYRYKSGLSRHKKTCKGPIDFSEDNNYMEEYLCNNEITLFKKNEKQDMNELIDIIKQQQQQLTESQKMMEKVIEETIPKIGNNNNNNSNNKISINVYLNKNCKDAMNLTDFVEQINVSIEDLLYTTQHGHAEGLANIFQKQLKDMNPTDRPIHCSDKKRLQFYVKDDDTWHKDEKHIKIDKTIHDIRMKQVKNLKKWEDMHPAYLTNEKLLDEWQLMVREIIGHGENDKDKEKNMISIKKQLASTIPFKIALKDNK